MAYKTEEIDVALDSSRLSQRESLKKPKQQNWNLFEEKKEPDAWNGRPFKDNFLTKEIKEPFDFDSNESEEMNGLSLIDNMQISQSLLNHSINEVRVHPNLEGFTVTRGLQFKGRPVQFTADSVRTANYHKLMQALQLDPDQPIPDEVIEEIKAMKA